jgi:hypothetical protein
VRAQEGTGSGRTAGASMTDGADASATSLRPSSITVAGPRRTHLFKKRRRHHAAPDEWRRRVANVDHHQRVGPLARHVSAGAAYGDENCLCTQHVTACA